MLLMGILLIKIFLSQQFSSHTWNYFSTIYLEHCMEYRYLNPELKKTSKASPKSWIRLPLNTAAWIVLFRVACVLQSHWLTKHRRAPVLLADVKIYSLYFCLKLDWVSSTSSATPISIVLICHGLCRLTSLSLVLAFKLLFSSPSSCLIILSFFFIGRDIFLTSPSYHLQRCFQNKSK